MRRCNFAIIASRGAKPSKGAHAIVTEAEGDHGVSSLRFLMQFITHPKSVGAIAASSGALADHVSDAAGVSGARAVVEFGPGTGVITEAILARLRPDATFFALEINDEFVKTMRERFPNVVVHKDSAANTRTYLEQSGHSSCDCIVSGLPWAAFEEELQDSLLDAIMDVLEPGGGFATYMYLWSIMLPAGRRFRRKLHERFAESGVAAAVWRNLPPAIVLWGKR